MKRAIKVRIQDDIKSPDKRSIYTWEAKYYHVFLQDNWLLFKSYKHALKYQATINRNANQIMQDVNFMLVNLYSWYKSNTFHDLPTMQAISSLFAEIDYLQLKACSSFLRWWSFCKILQDINEKLLTISKLLNKEHPYFGQNTLNEKINSINKEIENFGLKEAEKKLFWTKSHPLVIENDLNSLEK
jgi:hypothetical protein